MARIPARNYSFLNKNYLNLRDLTEHIQCDGQYIKDDPKINVMIPHAIGY